MKSNKGFTLIELLAVIVILAIIALIATPVILSVIDTAKKGAAESSALGYVDGIEKQILLSQYYGSNELTKGTHDISFVNDKIKLKGTKPTSGNVYINDSGAVETALLCINNYKISYQESKAKVLDNNCDDMSPVTPSTYTVYANGTAVYFNPVSGAKCTAGEAVSTTGTKTGCMKWYAFNDNNTSSTVNLILDHNTTASEYWNPGATNVNGPINVKTTLNSDTSSWAGVPTRTDNYSVANGTATYTIDYSTYKARLITAGEIATITGNNVFDEETTDSSYYYYFDSNNQTQTVTTVGASNYDWLFDYTYGCTSSGCNIADNSNFGYWTATATSGDTESAWTVNQNGRLEYMLVEMNGFGIRPVITISKSNL